ncbi:MAG: SEC-C metal-binding domain-containing protein, partial [Phycisphaerae bacterium]|nr:SEC-C metal-binding domain-containing protein [Phycisphaerae bacterium]
GMKDGVPLESRMVSRSIEKAQRRVEEHHFGTRKRLLEYDEVMDTQRKIFYQQRQALLEGRQVEELIWRLIDDSIDDTVNDRLDVDYRGRCIGEWARSAFDVALDPKDVRDASFEEVSELLRSRAKDEAAQNIGVTIGEYMEDEDDPRTWDTHGLASWAMSRFSVSLSATQLRKMTPDEVSEHLSEAALAKLDQYDFSPVQPYLEPDYPQAQLVDWAAKKFDIQIPIERLRGQEPEAAAEVVKGEVRALYRRREVEYPVHYALRASVAQTSTEDPYAADMLVRWANYKYQLNWSLPDVQGKSIEALESKLIDHARAYAGGRLDSEVESAVRDAAGQPDALSQWARRRFDTDVPAAALAGEGAKAALVSAGRSFFRRELTELERYLLIDIFDAVWKDHLYAMDHLKDSIGLRGFAERDPLIEFKREGFRMFEEMLKTVRDRVTDVITKVQLSAPARSRYNISEARHDEFGDGGYGVQAAANAADRQAADQAGREGKVKQIVRTGPDVGANEPCPCGSGKKYKKCCGRKAG